MQLGTLVETPTSGPVRVQGSRSEFAQVYESGPILAPQSRLSAGKTRCSNRDALPYDGPTPLRVLFLRGTIRYPRHACPGEKGATPVTSPLDVSVYYNLSHMHVEKARRRRRARAGGLALLDSESR